MTKKHKIICLIIIIVIHFYVSYSFFLTRPLTIMEGEEFRALASAHDLYRLVFNNMNISWFHQPINTIILNLLYFDPGMPVALLRCFYLVTAMISIAFMYKLLLLFENDYCATALTFLFSLNPLVLFYGASVQSYMVVTLFFIGHLIYLFKYLNRKKKRYIVLSLIFVDLAFFSHISAVFYGPILALFFVAEYRIRSKQILLLLLFYIPVIVYFSVLFIYFNQLSSLNHPTKYLYYKNTEMFFFLTESMRVAYSMPHWLVPVVIVIIASLYAMKHKHQYSRIILFLNLLFFVATGASFSILYFNDLGYFTVRHLMLLVPLFFLNITLLFSAIKNRKIQFGSLLILALAMIASSYNIYKKNIPVDYASLNSHLSSLVKDNDALFFAPEFIQLPFDYEVLNLNLSNISYDKKYAHYVYYQGKKIFLIGMDHPDPSTRDVESYFFSKKLIETIYHYCCNLRLKRIWVVFPKERLFGVYHLDFKQLESYITGTKKINNNIHLKPVTLTDTFDIFKLEVGPGFCF